MLTSHEFMIANKKRRNNDNNGRNKQDVNGNLADDPFGNNPPMSQPPVEHKKRQNAKKKGGRQQARHRQQPPKANPRKKSPDAYEQGYTPEVVEGKVYQGIVQNYYREKGYGFIRCEDFEVPAFFHYSEIQLDGFKYLIKQQKVEFKARVSDDGKLQAFEVTPTELAPTQKRQIFNRDGGSDK